MMGREVGKRAAVLAASLLASVCACAATSGARLAPVPIRYEPEWEVQSGAYTGGPGLLLRYVSAVCGPGSRLTPQVRETAKLVTVRLYEEYEPGPGPTPPCTSLATPQTLVVRLARALRGRKLRGGDPRFESFSRAACSTGAPYPVPLVLGFAPADAVRALGRDCLNARIRAEGPPALARMRRRPRLAEVVGEHPLARSHPAAGFTVSLVVAPASRPLPFRRSGRP